MPSSLSRRDVVRSLTLGGCAAALGDTGFLGSLPPVRADEAKVAPASVRFDPTVEPLVRLLEDTPREKLLEEVAARIKQGTSYRDVLAALLLAGVRNVQPRPDVGFKFHAVLVVNSAHIASVASPDAQRWLPIFWAIDHFKSAQAQDKREGDWTMPAVDEPRVPKASAAKAGFIKALDDWDEAGADVAAAGVARHCGAADVFETFFRYGARDFRSIGHKAIYVANSWRTLSCIGWQHAEPVLRSLAYALLNHRGQPNPAKSDLPADRPGRRNAELVKKIREDWRDGKLDDGATRELLAVLRGGSSDEAVDLVVAQLNRGIAVQSIWDGLLVGAGELLVRQPGIVGLHTLTTTNALHFAYQATASDETRRFVLLQNAAFLPLFREAMFGRGKVGDAKLDEMQAKSADNKSAKPEAQLDGLFRDVSGNRSAAAQGVLDYLAAGGTAQSFVDAARLHTFFKGRDSHDYKFSSAVLEDYAHVSPGWRGRFLAASVYNLKGSSDRDNDLVKRTRAALS